MDGGEEMKRNLIKLVSVTVATGIFVALSAPGVFAQSTGNDTVSICPAGNDQLCKLTFFDALPQILNILLFVAFLAALIFLIYGGIRWILSGGDKEGTSKAKGTVTAALIGMAIVLSSWLLINVVMNLFGISSFTINNLFGQDMHVVNTGGN